MSDHQYEDKEINLMFLESEKKTNFLYKLFDEFILASAQKNIRLFKWRNRLLLLIFVSSLFFFTFNDRKKEFEAEYANKQDNLKNFLLDEEKELSTRPKELTLNNSKFYLVEEDDGILKEDNNEYVLNDKSEEEQIAEIKAIINETTEEEKKEQNKTKEIKVTKEDIIKEEIKESKKTVTNITSMFQNVDNKNTVPSSNTEVIPSYYVQMLAVYDRDSLNKFITKMEEMGIGYKIDVREKRGKPLYILKSGPFEGYSVAKEQKSIIETTFKLKTLIKKVKN